MEDLAADVLATDVGFAEGPVLARDGSVWVTAMDQSRLVRIDGAAVRRGADRDGAVSSIPVGGAPNGLTEGPAGRMYVAQCGTDSFPGGIQVVGPDGAIEFLCGPGAGAAGRAPGRGPAGPASPNDLCIGPDGWLWVTDPTRPLGSGTGRLWRCHLEDGRAEVLAELDWYPNGIGFGPDDDTLFVARTGEGQIVRFPVSSTPSAVRLGAPTVAVQMDRGQPDGFAFDIEGRLIVAAVELEHDRPGTIQTWALSEGAHHPAGAATLVDRFEPGEGRLCTNVALGRDRVLLVTDASAGRVLAFADRPVAGLALHPFRWA